MHWGILNEPINKHCIEVGKDFPDLGDYVIGEG